MRPNKRFFLACLLMAFVTATVAGALESAAAVTTKSVVESSSTAPTPARVQVAAAAPDSACTATADCCDDSWVSCSGSGTCTAVDVACPAQRGYVQCDGVTTYCPACNAPACQPPGCTTTQCVKDLQCYDWCMQHEGYPGVCRNNCCICW